MYKLHTSLETLPKFDTVHPCFCDIETDGLYINPRIFQIYQPAVDELVHIIDFTYVKLADLIPLVKPLWLVFFNASYDLGTLNFVPDKLDDLFYATKMAYPEFQTEEVEGTTGKKFSLDNVAYKLGFDDYKDINKAEQHKANWTLGAYLSVSQLTYAATDCTILHKIWVDPKVMKVRESNKAYKVDILSLMYTIIWQQNGMPVIRENYNKALKATNDDIEKYSLQIPTITDKKGNRVPINTRSSKQVKEVLVTAKSDKPTLTRLMSNGHPMAKEAEAILNLRKALNDKSKLVGYNFPMVIGKFNPYGTITGRYNCTGGDIANGINMQNYPRKFKGIFGAVAEDEVIIGADYATLELRLACMIYGEPNMYVALMEGKDLHRYTASLMTGKSMADVTDDERQNAKPVNFGFTFGLSAENFIEYAFDLYGLKFDLNQSYAFRNQFFNAYPRFKQYHEYVYKSMKSNTYMCSTALGRMIKPKLGTEGINAPVQGSGAECTKLAVHYMVQEDIRSLEVIMNVIHDAIYLRTKATEAEYWKDLLQRNMVKAWENISKSSLFKYHDIPMPVEVKIGKTVKDV